MKRTIIMISLLAMIFCLKAQNNLIVKITDCKTNEILFGATIQIQNTTIGSSVNNEGFAEIKNINNGKQSFVCRFIGYKEEKLDLDIPLKTSDTLAICLQKDETELDDVIIVSTRSNRSIKNIPTRIEFLSEEELSEKTMMKSGDIRMILSESTGIQTQQTSATSGNSSIRIQGLDGRYTQILKDGFPTFSGAASGLGLLQTPPLDLKQVEIIKGSASTLYGAGAIAGLVNLISKTPQDERELSFLADVTHTKGTDFNVFYSQKYGVIGTTILATFNHNGAYSPSHTDFTAIPKFNRFVLNPKLFVYFNTKTQLDIGINSMFENRKGGDINFLEHKNDIAHSYFEYNDTKRFSIQSNFSHSFDENRALNIKTSWSYFNREITIPDYIFTGTQNSTFSEINYSYNKEKIQWIAGINLWSDDFKEKKHSDFMKRNYNQITAGAFVQNTYSLNNKIALESGLRYDYIDEYGSALLPRISILYKITDKVSSRLGGGLGYKTPTIFTEETESIHYKNILPVNSNKNKLERSYGANWDINFTTGLFGDIISFSINQLLFYTYINNPLLLKYKTNDVLFMENIDGYIDSKGAETNIKLAYEDFHLFLGYTYTNAQTKDNGEKYSAYLTPKHKINAILMYEQHENWRVGLESYYFSSQRLNDGQKGKQYIIFGLLIEKTWDKISIYANFENFTDQRQTRWESIYTGSHTNPQFRDIYTSLEGFVFTLGAKIKL